MTTPRKVPIAEQLEVAKLMLYSCGADLTLNERECAEGLLRFLQWCNDNPDILHTASIIWKDDRTRQVREAFPGAKLVGVRKIGAEYTDD